MSNAYCVHLCFFVLCLMGQQTNKQILYYPQTLYSLQGVKTSNKYIEIDDSSYRGGSRGGGGGHPARPPPP